MNKLIAPDDVTFVFVEAQDVGDWYREFYGAKGYYRYESVARNYLVSRAKDWTGEEPLAVLSEVKLAIVGNHKRVLRVDAIFVYPKDVWLLEVKSYRYCRYDRVFSNPNKHDAVNQLYKYRERVEELKMWPNKKIRLAVFWSYNPSTIENIELPLSEAPCLVWPKDRAK